MSEKFFKANRRSHLITIAGFSSLVLETLNKSPLANDYNILPIRQKLAPLCRELNAFVNSKQPLSPLAYLDKERDIATRSFYYFCHGLSKHPDNTIATAAQKYLDLFAEHGLGVLRASYTIQDSFTAFLITKSQQQDFIDALELLDGGNELLNQLIVAHENYKSQRILLGHDNGIKKTGPTGTELKNKVLLYLNEGLVNFLRFAVISHGDKYLELSNTLRELYKKFNVEVKLGHQPENQDPKTDDEENQSESLTNI